MPMGSLRFRTKAFYRPATTPTDDGREVRLGPRAGGLRAGCRSLSDGLQEAYRSVGMISIAITLIRMHTTAAIPV